MSRGMGKKAIFFTVTAAVLLLIVIFALTQKPGYEGTEKAGVVETRVKAMNGFVKNIEKDLEKGLRITATRALLGIEEKIATKGQFLASAADGFKGALVNGTVEGELIKIMENNTFFDWAQSIEEEAAAVDLKANITITNLSVYQENPWAITLEANTTISLSDNKGTASWSTKKTVKSEVSILGFEDPAYTVKSLGLVINTINKTLYEGNYVIGSDPSNLKAHIDNGFYTENPDAPNFLMRFEGNFSASPQGIESIVHLGKFQQQGLSISLKSGIDHVYFGDAITPIYTVSGVYTSWFRIDANHVDKYQVGGLIS